jgi:hypothetical protein
MAAESDLRLMATNAPPATITNSATVFLQIGKPDNALIILASALFGTSLAVVVWRMFKTQTAPHQCDFYDEVKGGL